MLRRRLKALLLIVSFLAPACCVFGALTAVAAQQGLSWVNWLLLGVWLLIGLLLSVALVRVLITLRQINEQPGDTV